MKARLYLHIGPPKTATTSLQSAFQEAEFDWLVYGGAFQPRENNAGSLAQRLHWFARGGQYNDSEVVKALDEIRKHLAAGRSVMISEEMFLVEQRDCGFVRKIDRLGRLLAEIPTTVLVTLRDPVDGLPSLYQELFKGLPVAEKLSFPRFCRGLRARCYDYALVHEVLRVAGFDDVRFLDFTHITSSVLPIGRLFGPPAPREATLAIGRSNTSEKARNDSRALPSVTLKAFGSLRSVKAVLDRSGIRERATYRAVVALLDGIALRPAGVRRLRVPDEVVERYRSASRTGAGRFTSFSEEHND